MKKKLLVFDIYGTLLDIHTVDSDASVWKLVKKMITLKTGKKPDKSAEKIRDLFFSLRKEHEAQLKEEYALCGSQKEEYVEYDDMIVFHRLLKQLGIYADDLVAEQIAKVYRISATQRISIYSEVEETLSILKKAGYKLALLSNAQKVYVEEDIGRLWKYFDYIYISSEHGIKKPSLRFYQKLLKEAQINPEDAAMIGNSAADDMAPAKRLGMYTVYMDSGLLKEPVPQEIDVLIDPDHFKRLAEIFK